MSRYNMLPVTPFARFKQYPRYKGMTRTAMHVYEVRSLQEQTLTHVRFAQWRPIIRSPNKTMYSRFDKGAQSTYSHDNRNKKDHTTKPQYTNQHETKIIPQAEPTNMMPCILIVVRFVILATYRTYRVRDKCRFCLSVWCLDSKSNRSRWRTTTHGLFSYSLINNCPW